MAKDREKQRKNNRNYYYRHRVEIRERRRKLYAATHEKARAEMDPQLASRMGGLRATPRRVLQQAWTRNLFERMSLVIDENASSRHARKTARWATRLILTHAEKSGLLEEHEITPAWLAGLPRQTKDRRKEPIYRANFGRMLLRFRLWSENDYQLFRENLVRLKRGGNPGQRVYGHKPTPSPPDELCRLVGELALRCALSVEQMRELRVSHIQANGLRIPPNPGEPSQLIPKVGRLIPFGDGWDDLPRITLDKYVRSEKPTDYLFFSRSPRDKKRPISKITLNGALTRQGHTVTSLRKQHLDEDFDRSRNLQEARFHLRNVHHLDNRYVHWLIAGKNSHTGYANEAHRIPIPMPYLLAAMCASRSVPEDRAKAVTPKGGERYLITWHNLLGYEITVDWKRDFAIELGGRGRTHVRALRMLFRLAFDFWFAGRRMKLPDVEDSEIRRQDKDLLRQLAATKVIVRDIADQQASWAASLFEYDTRQRSFRIPLIEEMNRRAWHNQCMVCCHPERDNIEREISEAATREGREKGYSLIARKYGVGDQSLAAHRGRKSPARGRGETQRSHFSTGSIAPIVRCPRKLWEQLSKLSQTELLVYTVVMFEQNRERFARVRVSTQWIEHHLGFRVDESQLSIVLNHLSSTGAGLIRDFGKEPAGGFQIVL